MKTDQEHGMYEDKSAEQIIDEYKSMNWEHEYAKDGILSRADAIKAAERYASLRCEEKDKRIKELEEALRELILWCESIKESPDEYYQGKKALQSKEL